MARRTTDVIRRKRPDKIDARVTRYVNDVLAGRIVVGRLVRQAVERHVRDLKQSKAYYFDTSEANFSLQFIECLRQSKGEWAGHPLHLEPWEAFIVASLFGWRQRSDNKRRFRTAYVEVARKNGKSTLAAAIGIKLFFADNEEGAEVYTAATKREQAKIVHEEAKRMVQASPALSSVVEIFRDNLTIARTNSKYQPLGKDANTLDGLNLHAAIVDEIHAHPTRELWDVLETATGARTQPVMLGITTAGEGASRESICWELRSYSQKVLEQSVVDDSWFAYVAALDEARFDANGEEISPADDWTDEANWPKANPNLGVTVKLDDLRRKFTKAIETPSSQPNFKRKHLNMWVESATSWLPAGLWDSCSGDSPWYDKDGLRPQVIEQFRGQPCWVGGDLASVDDLTALCFAFQSGQSVDVIPAAWCPRDNAVGRSRDRRVPYLAWSTSGELMLTEGNSVDYEAVRAFLKRARNEWGWDVQEVAFDPHNARYLQSLLIEDGFKVTDHRQGFISMNDPIKQAQRLILDRKLRHGGHRPLAWCVSNIVATHDASGNIKFDKERSGDKIDIAVAMVMAVGRAIDHQAGSAYDNPAGFYADDFLTADTSQSTEPAHADPYGDGYGWEDD